MKKKRMLKLKKDLKRDLKPIFDYTKKYRTLWLSKFQTSITIGKDHLGGAIFHKYWGDPIWDKTIFLLNDLTGKILGNTYYPEKFRDDITMSYNMKGMIAMCHPHIAYFDYDDEITVALLPMSKSKMTRRIMDIILCSHKIAYISTNVVNSEVYADVDSSLMNYLPDAIDIGISEKSEMSTSSHIIRTSNNYSWGMNHEFI